MAKTYSKVQTRNTNRQHPGCSKEEKVFIVKSTFLRRMSRVFLASGLVGDGDLPGVRALDDGCQAVQMCRHCFSSSPQSYL